MNNVNIKHIDFSTVLKRKTVVKSKPYYAQGWFGSRPMHVENFLYLKLVWVLFTKRFRKIRVESKWSTTFLVTVVSAENFREQRNIKKKKIRPTLKHVLLKDYFQCFHFIHLFTKIRLEPVSNVVLLQCRTKLIELNSTLARQTSATFETK